MKAVKFARSPVLAQPLPRWRQRLVLFALLVGLAVLVGRAFYLQGIDNDFLGDKGKARFERVLEISATRGRITDRHGDVLAVSTPVRSIWAIPQDAEAMTPAQTRQLAGLLGLPVRELNRKLAADRGFVYLKRQIPPPLAEQVMAMNLPGIHQQTEYRRYYPSGEVMAHLIGFTGVDESGQEGIEKAFDEQLRGKPGSRRVIRDRRGNVVEHVGGAQPPTQGRDLALALDAKIQYLAYTHLRQALITHRARAGGAVVLDARSGEVLALVNLPAYNPNGSRRPGGELRNRALTDNFEPGSTLKPFTIALAMDKGKVLADTPIQTAPGRLSIGPATISDTHPHELLSVAQVIQKSSNVGSAKIALMMQPSEMWEMFVAAGFGAPLRLGFPGEAKGHVRPAASWRPIEQATMSYGHGISVTLVQLAHAYLAFARDGDLLPLSLIRRDAPPDDSRRLFSAATARQVREMMEMAVQAGGTAPKARIPGYRVAGKTGTARKIEDGRYVRKYVASFAGFAPVSAPRLVIAVMVDEPSNGKYYGGEVAAPVFAEVMAGSLRALGVAPDAPLTPLAPVLMAGAAAGEEM